jgi:L-fucose isomerase-like protein
MSDYSLRIGLAPVRRNLPGKRTGIFNQDYAKASKDAVVAHIRKHFEDAETTFFDLEYLNEEGLLFDEKLVPAIADHFRAEKIDALFIINCNFGNEEAAGQLAAALRVPVLIWAPQDTIFEVDGTRYTDAQCGLFAVAKFLHRVDVPFSHIENCRITDKVFASEFRKFLSVASMVKTFKGLKVVQVGCRPKPFTSVIVNEGELMERFGIQISPVNLAIVIKKHAAIMENKKEALATDVASFKSRYNVGELTDVQLAKMMAFKYIYREIKEETGCGVISTECWTAMLAAVDAMPCCAMSELADEGLIVTCESDIHGAITMALLAAASRGKSVPFFIEFTVRHPEDRNIHLLWHCGPVAYSLKHPEVKASVFNVKCNFRLKDGKYTIARMDALKGQYSLLGGSFETAKGPYTFGNYLWARFSDLKAVEKKLIEGPYIHHMAEIEGDYTEALAEFCKFIPGLAMDPMPTKE